MERLASCYFCGTALDAPRDVPVVPDALRDGDPEATVTLCADCEGKLAPVVDRVADAASAGGTAERRDGTSTSARSGDADAPGGADETADPSDTDDPADRAGETAGETADGPRTIAGGEAVTFGVTADDEAESTSDEADASGETDTSGDEASETSGGADTEGEATSDDGAAADAEAATDDGETAADAEGTDDPARPSATATDSEDRPAIDPMDYRRVVRLLQNREFPVDRAEVEALAESAYDLSPATCTAIVDAAIERGRVGADGDQLVAPE